MDVKIDIKVMVGGKVALRSVTVDWWDKIGIEEIADDIKEAIENIE